MINLKKNWELNKAESFSLLHIKSETFDLISCCRQECQRSLHATVHSSDGQFLIGVFF